MPTEKQIPQCSHCNATLVERRTKNNRVILACPNWRPDGKGCPGTIYDPKQDDERKKIYPRVVIRRNAKSKSEPGKFRTVEVYEDGHMRCNCIAADMQRFCRHQKETGKWLKDLVRLMEKENNINFDEIEKKEEDKPGEEVAMHTAFSPKKT